MASGQKGKDDKVKVSDHKGAAKEGPHPHVSHDHGKEAKSANHEKQAHAAKDDEAITISGQAILIGVLVILAVGLVVWKVQSDASPAGAPQDQTLKAPEVPDEVVAKVNGEDVMRSYVLHQMDQLPQAVKGQIGFDEILNASINEIILVQEARRLGIEKSAAEANAYLALTLNKSGIGRDELKQRAKDRGIEESEIVEIFRKRLTINELFQQKVFPTINITDKEVKDYYMKNKADLAIPEMVHAKHILLSQPEEANATMARLKKGADFEQLAKDLSIDKASAVEGGDLGNFTKDQMIPEFEKAAFDAKAGSLVGPIQTQFGYHIIKVVSHTKSRDRPFDEVKDAIRKKIQADRSEEAANTYVEQLRAAAKVEWLAKTQS